MRSFGTGLVKKYTRPRKKEAGCEEKAGFWRHSPPKYVIRGAPLPSQTVGRFRHSYLVGIRDFLAHVKKRMDRRNPADPPTVVGLMLDQPRLRQRRLP